MTVKRIKVRRGSNGAVPPIPSPAPSDEVDNLRIDGVLPVDGARYTLPISGGGFVLNTDPAPPPVVRERTSSQEATELMETLIGAAAGGILNNSPSTDAIARLMSLSLIPSQAPRVGISAGVGVPLQIDDGSVTNVINRTTSRISIGYDIQNALLRSECRLVIALDSGDTTISAGAILRSEELILRNGDVVEDIYLYAEELLTFRLMEALRAELSRVISGRLREIIRRDGLPGRFRNTRV